MKFSLFYEMQIALELGVDELILVIQMRTVPSALVLESIKTFGEKVIFHFA